MELEQLRSFIAIAETRSFTKAAALAHLSQPTISRQINRLEMELGTQLFERYGHQVELTESGEFLLPSARAILKQTNRLVSMMREHEGKKCEQVCFGATSLLLNYLLPRVLTPFMQDYPHIQIDLVEREDSTLEDAVARGEIDCAMVTRYGPPRVTVVHLFSEEIFLVVSTNHRFATRSSVSLTELEEEPLVMPPISMNIARHIAEACRKAGFEPKIASYVNYLGLSKSFARQERGVLLLPKMALDPQKLEGLAIVPLEDNFTRDLDLIYSGERPLSAITRVFMAYLRKSVPRLKTVA
jgi:DNA-binding transcriptional LysR family regulator